MSTTLKIAICDDEGVQVQLLDQYVRKWAEDKKVKIEIEHFYSGEAFNFAWSMDRSYHILLLDIEMKGINGVDLAKEIRLEDELINIIFITAIVDYIAEGYNVAAINYLIKPIEEERLYESLNRVRERIKKKVKTILIEDKGEISRLVQDEIIYIEAFSHEIKIVSLDKEYMIRKNIGVIEKELDRDSFVRSHRSYIVGLKHIRRISRNDALMENGLSLPISRNQYKKVNKAFIDYHRGDLDGF